jgi:hypothetical protein
MSIPERVPAELLLYVLLRADSDIRDPPRFVHLELQRTGRHTIIQLSDGFRRSKGRRAECKHAVRRGYVSCRFESTRAWPLPLEVGRLPIRLGNQVRCEIKRNRTKRKGRAIDWACYRGIDLVAGGPLGYRRR